MLKFKNGRFELENLSFQIPDNTFLTTVSEVELDNGLVVFTEDMKIKILMAGYDSDVSAREMIDSIFDEDSSFRKMGEMTEICKANLNGIYVIYESAQLYYIEACFALPNIINCGTFAIQACTEKKHGKYVLSRMLRLHSQMMDSIRIV